MIKLQDTYKCRGQKGFTYEIVKREGSIVLSKMIDDKSGLIVGYEVFVIQEYPERVSPDGVNKIEAREACPSSESWGKKGFSYTKHNLDHAEARFWELCRIHNDMIGATRKKNGVIKKAAPEELYMIFQSEEYKEHLKQRQNEKH